MWYLFGLGNPGGEYEGTRHNLGYEVLDELADRFAIRFLGGGRTFAAGAGKIGGESVQLIKPTRFMNRSGLAWRELEETGRFDPERAVVIYDDLHIELGRLRIRAQGSDGGHNGLASILKAAGHDRVQRIRLGTGGEDSDWVEHVLSAFTPREREIADALVELAADAVETLVTEGFQVAMTRFSGKIVQEPK